MYLHPKTDVNYILKSEGREREREKKKRLTETEPHSQPMKLNPL